jgi:rhamnosyltransferase
MQNDSGQFQATKNQAELICAVVVTFNPDLERLDLQLNQLTSQVGHVLLVDNGSGNHITHDLAARVSDKIELILLGLNTGIAKAQNVGIETGRQLGAKYILLMDQDSVPANNYVEQLLIVANEVSSSGVRLASVGGYYMDERHPTAPPFIRIKGLRLVRYACAENRNAFEVDYLISSGLLIPSDLFDRVGMMREDFFIDYVDIEWGLRARRAGYKTFGVCGARMNHQLGEMPHVFFGRGIPIHTPLRHYYLARNSTRLYCEKDIPLNWKIVDASRMLLKYIYYSLFGTPNSLNHWRMMTYGIFHGLINRLGSIEQASCSNSKKTKADPSNHT